MRPWLPLVLSSTLLLCPLRATSDAQSVSTLHARQDEGGLGRTTSSSSVPSGAHDRRRPEPAATALRRRFVVLSREEAERERQRMREHAHQHEVHLTPERDPTEAAERPPSASAERPPSASAERPPSVDIVHAPRGAAAERGGPAGEAAVTTTRLGKALEVQRLTFPRGRGRHRQRHRYLAELGPADTATVVLRGDAAWLVFDTIHYHRDPAREERFRHKLRGLRGRAGAGGRRVFHIEPRWRESTEDLPAHAAIQAIVDARRREVLAAFGPAHGRAPGDELVFRKYPAHARLAVDNLEWEHRERLALRLDGREVVGGALPASMSVSHLC